MTRKLFFQGGKLLFEIAWLQDDYNAMNEMINFFAQSICLDETYFEKIHKWKDKGPDAFFSCKTKLTMVPKEQVELNMYQCVDYWTMASE